LGAIIGADMVLPESLRMPIPQGLVTGISALPSPSKSLLFAAILVPLLMNAVGLDSRTTPVPSAGAQRSGRQQTRWIPVFAGMMER